MGRIKSALLVLTIIIFYSGTVFGFQNQEPQPRDAALLANPQRAVHTNYSKF